MEVGSYKLLAKRASELGFKVVEKQNKFRIAVALIK